MTGTAAETEPHPIALPKLKEGVLRIIPHGGLGEVGRNMTSFEIDGKILIIDCGVLFPESTQPGVDLILPDIESLGDRLDDVVGIFLTHGHEDHIGGVPYLLKQNPGIPLIGSQLTLALVEAKLKEHRIKPYTLTVREGDVEELGPFRCEFMSISHSIPDSLGIHVTTKAGTFVHTADLKVDPSPLDGRLTDLVTLGRLGAEASTCGSVTRRTPRSQDSRARNASSGRRFTRRFARRASASSSRASPATFTACSTSSMPPSRTTARLPSWGAR